MNYKHSILPFGLLKLKGAVLFFFITLFSFGIPLIEMEYKKQKVDLWENEEENNKENEELKEEKLEVKKSKGSDIFHSAFITHLFSGFHYFKNYLAIEANVTLSPFFEVPLYILFCCLLIDFV